jgi:predicted metalloprotease with PDZ domain
MKLATRLAGLLVCVLLVAAVVRYAWHQKPQPTRRLSTRETNLDDSTSAPLARATETGLPVPNPSLEDGQSPMKEIVGIGASLNRDKQTGGLRILNVLPSSPAAKEGLSAGLIIHTVDGVIVTGLPLAQCIALIRDAIGTKVRLELIDPVGDATNTVVLTRGKNSVVTCNLPTSCWRVPG